MNRKLACRIWIASTVAMLLFAGLGNVATAQQTTTFRAGFAERDITPDIGMEQPGGYGKAFHASIHDPCKVRAVVFAEDDRRVAIVSVDALLVQRRLVLAARERIEASLGIEGDAVLIHATHSHSSGPTGMIYPGDFDHASEFVQQLAYEKNHRTPISSMSKK